MFDESVVVESMLFNNDTNAETVIDAGSPSLSKVTMGDITTFLAKSGHQQVSPLKLKCSWIFQISSLRKDTKILFPG